MMIQQPDRTHGPGCPARYGDGDCDERTAATKCKHCGRPILMGPPSPDLYWYHPGGQSVYCNLTTPVTRAEPWR